MVIIETFINLHVFMSNTISCEVPMGDLQSEEERDIVLEVKLPSLPTPQQALVMKASLSYFNIITSSLDTVTFDLIVNRKG